LTNPFKDALLGGGIRRIGRGGKRDREEEGGKKTTKRWR